MLRSERRKRKQKKTLQKKKKLPKKERLLQQKAIEKKQHGVLARSKKPTEGTNAERR